MSFMQHSKRNDVQVQPVYSLYCDICLCDLTSAHVSNYKLFITDDKLIIRPDRSWFRCPWLKKS